MGGTKEAVQVWEMHKVQGPKSFSHVEQKSSTLSCWGKDSRHITHRAQVNPELAWERGEETFYPRGSRKLSRDQNEMPPTKGEGHV